MLETVVYGGLEWELFAQRERDFTRREKWALFLECDISLPEKKEMSFTEHCERLQELPGLNNLPGSATWRAPYFWEINKLHIDGLRNRLNPKQMRLWHDIFSSGIGEWYNHGISRGFGDFTLYLDARDGNSKFATLRLEDCFLYPRRKECLIYEATPLFHLLFYHCLSSQLPPHVLHETIRLSPPNDNVYPVGRRGNRNNCCLAYDLHFASRGVRELKSYSGR